jgi:hypothetical protein
MISTLKFSHIRVKSIWLRVLLGASFGFPASQRFYLQLSCYMISDYLKGNPTCSYLKVKLVTLFLMPWDIYAVSLGATHPRFKPTLCAGAHVHYLRSFTYHWKISIFIWGGALTPVCLNNIFAQLFRGKWIMIFSMIYYLQNFLFSDFGRWALGLDYCLWCI